jgi:hypothetical protein
MIKTSIIFILTIIANLSFAKGFNYRHEQGLNSKDYLFKDRSAGEDNVFDQYQTVDLGFNLSVGSDCGKVDFKSTLQGTLKNVLDAKYFESVGSSILSASPMLMTCYFSPTWCSILKHTRINANFLSQMRLDQCALIDKYTDNRSEDFKKERQECVHKSIKKNGGNIEKALKQCQSGSVNSFDLSNWAGQRFGDKSSQNKLIESSAKWAGFNDSESKRSIELVKSLVGDTVVGKGRISVDYGPKNKAITPRLRLYKIERDTYKKLCKRLLKKLDQNTSVDSLKDDELKIFGENKGENYLDRQTLHYLSILPYIKRGSYCRKLAYSISLTKFSKEMNRSLDILNILEQNPNLPDNRKIEISNKRSRLKESIDSTLNLQKLQNTPLNRVISTINQEGQNYEGAYSNRILETKASRINAKRTREVLFDCADGLLCHKGGL